METKTIVYLVDDYLKDKTDWKFVEPLMQLHENELSPREKALMDKYWDQGCFYHAQRMTNPDGSHTLTTDLGTPEDKISITFPSWVKETDQITALKAVVRKLI